MSIRIMAMLGTFPIAIALSGGSLASGDSLTPIEKLGKKIFFNEDLSIRKNQACASCHDPEAGWTGSDSKINA